MNRILFSISLFFALAWCSACRKFVEVPLPPDQIVSTQVFTSTNKAHSAVTAIYGNMINGPQSFSNFLTTVYGGLSADELNRFNPSLLFQEFLNNELTATNGQVRNLWSTAYKTLYHANAVLEGLEKSNGVDGTTRLQLQGECKLLRAFCYFYLVNLYGDVPLVVHTDYAANAVLPRSPVSQVYQQMTADLRDARNTLPKSYPGGDKGRPTYWAACALLARVHLYQGQWDQAEAMATMVLEQGPFGPLPAPSTVFLKNSSEAIWQLAPTNGSMQETRQMKPSGVTPQVFLRPGLLHSFETGDQRRLRWVDSITYQSVKYFYPGKYKNTSVAVTEYYMVLRAAEQLLIRAEARVQQQKLSLAIADLNAVRTRAGLPPLSDNLSQGQVAAAIEQERRIELFGEWAHRWLDLKRWDRATAVLSAIKTNWQPTDALYPIPQDEILLNPSLTQNPGY